MNGEISSEFFTFFYYFFSWPNLMNDLFRLSNGSDAKTFLLNSTTGKKLATIIFTVKHILCNCSANSEGAQRRIR